MKPRLKFSRGWWWCGMPGDYYIWWTTARSPSEAFNLWRRWRA